jgi:hypothetical protein
VKIAGRPYLTIDPKLNKSLCCAEYHIDIDGFSSWKDDVKYSSELTSLGLVKFDFSCCNCGQAFTDFIEALQWNTSLMNSSSLWDDSVSDEMKEKVKEQLKINVFIAREFASYSYSEAWIKLLSLNYEHAENQVWTSKFKSMVKSVIFLKEKSQEQKQTSTNEDPTVPTLQVPQDADFDMDQVKEFVSWLKSKGVQLSKANEQQVYALLEPSTKTTTQVGEVD